MTVAIQTYEVLAAGNGSATDFSFSPMVLQDDSSQLQVTIIDSDGVEGDPLVEGTGATNYTVVPTTDYPSTGSVTYPSTGATRLATGSRLRMKRVLVIEQPTELENQGGYFPDVQEAQFDRLVMIDLQQQEEIDRAVKVPAGRTDDLTDLATAILTLADDIISLDAVAADLTKINGVYDDLTKINGVYDDLTNIDTVYGDLASVDIVAGDHAEILVVAGDHTAIQSAYTNIDAIIAAPTQAQIATDQAAIATAAASGMKFRSARLATTANITLSGAQTIDSVSAIAGDRVLVKSQSAPAENGIYVVASGSWTRATDSDTWAEVFGTIVGIEEGTTNANTGFMCTSNQGGTLGSTAITYGGWATLILAGSITSSMLAASLALVTPSLGVATATSLNGLTISTSTGTLTVANLKTLTVSNSLTLAGTDGTIMTFPAETASIGFRGIPPQSKSADYTCVLGDAGKSIDHPSTDANARTFTIPANGSVAYDIGTTLTFTNMDSHALAIAITTDTLYLAGAGTTGSRSLAQYGVATARKQTSTTWLISGTGLS